MKKYARFITAFAVLLITAFLTILFAREKKAVPSNRPSVKSEVQINQSQKVIISEESRPDKKIKIAPEKRRVKVDQNLKVHSVLK